MNLREQAKSENHQLIKRVKLKSLKKETVSAGKRYYFCRNFIHNVIEVNRDTTTIMLRVNDDKSYSKILSKEKIKEGI